jgi:UDP-N-acetylmuramoyl-tripeptide--D-alanyl-D-alanine ligase
LTRCPEIPVHVEFFKDGHALNEEDQKIVKTLKKDGIMVLNADDENIIKLRERYDFNVVTYGVEKVADVRGGYDGIFYENDILKGFSMHWVILGEIKNLIVRGVIGRHMVYPVVSAVAVGRFLAISNDKCLEALENFKLPKGRMNILEGIHDSIIIDDSYNSSPVAMEEAILAFRDINTREGSKKIAVLGDMLELGLYTKGEHIRIGKLLAFVDRLVTVGLRAEDFAVGAVESGLTKKHIQSFTNSEEAISYLKRHVENGDVVLAKGSQGSRVEKAIKAILKDESKAKELLMRQEKEWAGR